MKTNSCISAVRLLLLLTIGLSALRLQAEEPAMTADVPALIRLLRDKSPRERVRAVRELEDLGARAVPAVPELIGLLDDHADVGDYGPYVLTVGSYASAALSRIGSPAVPELTKALASPNPAIRQGAAGALRNMRSPVKEAVAPLVETLKDADKDVRRETAKTLAEFGPLAEPALPALFTLLEKDPDWNVRYYGVYAAAAIDREGKRAIPVLIRALADRDPEVRSQAVERLGQYGPRAEAAVGALIKMLADPTTRTAFVTADMMGSYPLRCDAAAALGKIGRAATAALPSLRTMMHSGDGKARAVAAQAVLDIDPRAEDVVPALIAVLQDRLLALDGAATAAEVLAKLGPKAAAAVPALKQALRDRDDLVRSAAILALGAVAGKEAIPTLLKQWGREKRLRDRIRGKDSLKTDGFVARDSLVEALGKLGPDAAAAVPLMQEILDDTEEDWGVQCQAVEALGQIGPKAQAAVPQLIRALDDIASGARPLAIEALGRIGPPAKAAVPPLLKMLDDANEAQRKDIEAAVRRIDAAALRTRKIKEPAQTTPRPAN